MYLFALFKVNKTKSEHISGCPGVYREGWLILQGLLGSGVKGLNSVLEILGGVL